MTTEPRKPGWYWVKLGNIGPWVPACLIADHGWLIHGRYVPKSGILVIGPRAPTPDEVGRCRDCKWWNNPSRDPEGICDSAFRAGSGIVLFGTDNCLYTKPNFGCVRFEKAAADAAGANPGTLGTLDEGNDESANSKAISER